MEQKARAFAKGSFGCLFTFVIVGLLVVALGGSMRLDLGGVVMLIVIGGVIGLVANWIYQKGKRDAGGP